jgi:CRP/FNR family transcriptional regulator
MPRTCAVCGLGRLCLASGIDPRQIAQLERVVQMRRSLKRGQFLVRSGDPFRTLYAVRSGSFKTCAETPEGEEQVIDFHLPGDLIGLDAYDSGVHARSTQALEGASVCEVPVEQLQDLLAQNPRLQRHLFRLSARALDRDRKHLFTLGRRQAQERIALFLLNWSERQRALLNQSDKLTLPMSRYELASYLGMAFETVSRVLSRFDEQGVIAVNRGRVQVRDFARLHALAGRAVAEHQNDCAYG